MNNEEKIEKSTAVGSLTLFVSCYGINIYEVATHDDYTNYQDSSFSCCFSWINLFIIDCFLYIYIERKNKLEKIEANALGAYRLCLNSAER